jgi:hypothetical protein
LLLRPPRCQKRIDSLFQLVEVAAKRAETVAADSAELADDPLGIADPHCKLDALTQPGDGELMLPNLVVGEAGGVVQPDILAIGGLQLGPDRGGLVLAPGPKVELSDV